MHVDVDIPPVSLSNPGSGPQNLFPPLEGIAPAWKIHIVQSPMGYNKFDYINALTLPHTCGLENF